MSEAQVTTFLQKKIHRKVTLHGVKHNECKKTFIKECSVK